MKKIQNLIENIGLCIPECNTESLSSSSPKTFDPDTILHWLYENLSKQNLIVYEEWKEYNGYIPDFETLQNITLPVEPNDFIFTLIDNIDWSESTIDPYDIPYYIPWLEHINHYLKPHGVRLVNILPFENAYIICLRDDDILIKNLDLSLKNFGMGIDKREPLDQQEVSLEMNSAISG
jgi:hypothetical protein